MFRSFKKLFITEAALHLLAQQIHQKLKANKSPFEFVFTLQQVQADVGSLRNKVI